MPKQMEKLSKVGCYEFLAEPFHCDFSGKLMMGHLGNHMLNAADFHSSARDFGMKYLFTVNRAWVLSRLAIEMVEMPKMYDKFSVETWVESAMRYFTNRNFRIVGESNQSTSDPQHSSSNTQHPKIYGYGRSVWAMIDTETRQPCDILSVKDGAINNWIENEKDCHMEKGGRVKMDDNAVFVRSIDTNYSDVDINGHINSVKYIEHVLNLWDLNWYREHAIKRFEIAYVAEAHAGDQLRFYKQDTGNTESCVRITKLLPDTNDEIEVVRSKVLFC